MQVDPGPNVVLSKVKRPGGAYAFDARHLVEDEHGTWLHLPRGSRWSTPHRSGLTHRNATVLICAGRPWVGWWIDDPAGPLVKIDVCLPPDPPTPAGRRWSFVDLELDAVLHVREAHVEIEDWDEFYDAVKAGVIDGSEAGLATTTAEAMSRQLQTGAAWLDLGWERLQAGRPGSSQA